jgi:bifunctional DNA-binding transcriptional regulator/antitoxin component of YhaV-PrlF toxin-antitoxin module
MITSKVTTKGQVTLPKAIREREKVAGSLEKLLPRG